MSKEYVEDLIKSAESKKQPKYLRINWTYQAKAGLMDLEKRIRKLQKELKLEHK